MLMVLSPEDQERWAKIEDAKSTLPKGTDIRDLVGPLNYGELDILEDIKKGKLPSDENIDWFVKRVKEYNDEHQSGLIP